MDYIKSYAQELDEEVIKKHISLYVNNFSVDLGTSGQNAIMKLFENGIESDLVSQSKAQIFLNKE